MLLQFAAVPVWIGLFCLYLWDRYEKEPFSMLFWGFLYGVYATFLIYGLGTWLEGTWLHRETPFFSAFVSSAAVEEASKLLFLFFLIYFNRNFNEPLDGAVYGAFVSLGFAWLENIVYVTHPALGGWQTALSRAVFSVPCHGLFGIEMGYWLAEAKFKKKAFGMAFLGPYVLHGVYNYLLFLQTGWAMVLFYVFVGYLWLRQIRHWKHLLAISPFRTEKISS